MTTVIPITRCSLATTELAYTCDGSDGDDIEQPNPSDIYYTTGGYNFS